MTQEDRRRADWTPGGTVVRLTLLVLAYYGLAKLGLLFALPGGVASPIWPPAGLAIAAVVLWGRRALPAIFIAAFGVEWQFTGSPGLGLVLALGSTASAALGGWLLQQAGGFRVFESLTGVARFAGAIAAAPLLAATVGAMALLAFGSIDATALVSVWWTWYLGDAAGALVVTPVVLLLPALWSGHDAKARLAETLAILTLVVASSAMLLGLVPSVPAGHPALLTLLMPPVVWAAFRLGAGPASLTLVALDAMAVLVTRLGEGPFTAANPTDAYLVLQAFIFAVGLMAFGLAALATERRIATAGLEQHVRDRTADLEDVNSRLRLEVQERARAQAAVAEAQHIAEVGSWRWDVTKPNAEWSAELYRIYALDPKTHVPTYADYLTRVHPDDVERVKAATDAVFRDHKAYSHDERIRRPDGSWRNLHTWAHAVLDDTGKLTHLVGVCQDVTVQRKAEAALRESLERFRALADASPIGIVHTRADGVVDYTNQRWRQITGVLDHTDTEALRRSVHPDDQAAAAQQWDACIKDGTEFACDIRFVHADGAVRFTRARAVPVRSVSGAITGFVSALADITDQRAAEAKDREVRLLREQAEFKTNFLRTAAHELGTPLTPIKIQMHILRGLLAGAGRDEERKAADILNRNISRLQVLVQDMLESARLQSGRLRLAVRPTDLAHLVHDVVETFQEPAIRSGIFLDTSGPHELPIVADPDRISQVLYNLLSNAMKFTPANGHVKVHVASEGEDQVRVTVTDTGSGFAPEKGVKLFQPFSQLHENLEVPRGGSGLGLYISRGIVEQHGGTMTGSSQGPGKGATFSFVLPRATPALAPSAAESLLESPAPAAR
ncbi:MAG: MASE1 domain-containing protein [Candidatus Thermoplasmatota archaeon]|jgi:PAS domain S-box-containing protein